MTRRQRLENRIKEIEQNLEDFANEMAEISEANLKKSDSEYARWVHNEFFVDEFSYFSKVERSNIECINLLKQVVGCLTEKPENKVKVIMTLNHEWYARVVWVDKEVFERMQENGELIECPECHNWVLENNGFTCTCGHQFKARKDVLELTSGGVIERYIQTGPYSSYCELVIDGKTYPAEYKLVPIENEKEGVSNDFK